MASLSSTTTGQDICEQALKVVEKFELNTAKLCGVTTDGAPSMTGRSKCSWSTRCSSKPLHYSPRELVHQNCGFCRSHEKCCLECKLHLSKRIISSAI